ncbi:MAG: hypothetical protein ACYTCU_06715 [Planctomycetota bacterium]|jgi:hypothetical protein
MAAVPRRPFRPLSCLVALALAMTSIAAPGVAQSMPHLLDDGAGGLDLWVVDETSDTAAPWLTGVTMQPLSLTAHPPRDALRTGIPTLHDDGPVDLVRLPQGGALYSLTTATEASLLMVGADGVPQVVFSVTADGPAQVLHEAIAVDTAGAWALVATTTLAGGDAWLLDLSTGTAPRNLTSSAEPLDIDDDSLRVSAASAWFEAEGDLYRADLATLLDASPVVMPLQTDEEVLPETVLAESGVALAVVLEGGGETERRVLVVPLVGAPVVVTDVPGAYELPSYENDLGPFMALDADGGVISYLGLVGTSVELYVHEVALPAPSLHVTQAPDFPAYMDNVGILGFTSARMLTFFAGDEQLSPVSGKEVMGAADLFQADLGTSGIATITNISETSGDPYPPFGGVGSMLFEEALLDPLADRFLLLGDEDGLPVLQTVPTTPYGAHKVVKTPLDAAFQDEPMVRGVGDAVLIHAAADGDDGEVTTPGELHLLGPLVQGAALELMLASVPPGVEFDRFSSNPSGDVVAFVASVGGSFEVPVLLEPETGLMMLAWTQPYALTQTTAFSSSGRLYVGLGVPGSYLFASFSGPGVGAKLPLPIRDGFPLPH